MTCSMEHTWQLQEAKNKFSNLVEKAQQEGPQFVTKHGRISCGSFGGGVRSINKTQIQSASIHSSLSFI